MALQNRDDTTRSARPRRSLRRTAGVVGISAAALVGLGACTPPQSAIDTVFGARSDEASAIARCESGMNPMAVSRTNDHGLFQINIVHQSSFTRTTGQAWTKVYEPYWNAVFAKRLFDSQGWRPWSCRYVLGQ